MTQTFSATKELEQFKLKSFNLQLFDSNTVIYKREGDKIDPVTYNSVDKLDKQYVLDSLVKLKINFKYYINAEHLFIYLKSKTDRILVELTLSKVKEFQQPNTYKRKNIHVATLKDIGGLIAKCLLLPIVLILGIGAFGYLVINYTLLLAYTLIPTSVIGIITFIYYQIYQHNKRCTIDKIHGSNDFNNEID